MLHFILELLLTTALTGVNADSKIITCYGFSGLAYQNNTRCPGSNACCGADATCLSNRLCHKPNDGPNTYLRGPCAIDPYDSGTCAQICLYDEKQGILPRINICADGSLCCDNDDHCCDDGKGIFLDENGVISDKAPSAVQSYGPERTAATFRMSTATASSSTHIVTSAVPSSTEASASSASSTQDAENEDSSNNKSSNNSGVKIGVGVAIPVACIAIGLGIWLWWRKRQASKHASADADKDYLREVSRFQNESAVNEGPKYELPAQHAPVELEGTSGR